MGCRSRSSNFIMIEWAEQAMPGPAPYSRRETCRVIIKVGTRLYPRNDIDENIDGGQAVDAAV